MTLKEQLLQEIEQAPDALLEELLRFLQEMKQEQAPMTSSHPEKNNTSARMAAQREAIHRLQTKMRETNPDGRSLVDELIAERRQAAENE